MSIEELLSHVESNSVSSCVDVLKVWTCHYSLATSPSSDGLVSGSSVDSTIALRSNPVSSMPLPFSTLDTGSPRDVASPSVILVTARERCARICSDRLHSGLPESLQMLFESFPSSGDEEIEGELERSPTEVFLRQHGVYPSSSLRDWAARTTKALVLAFVRDFHPEAVSSLPDSSILDTIPQGSFLLKTDLHKSDIDLVCVFSRFVPSSGFFEEFPLWLRSISRLCGQDVNVHIANIRSVPTARVPLVTFTVGTVQIELAAVWTNLSTVESHSFLQMLLEEESSNYSFLRVEDDPSTTSSSLTIINGLRLNCNLLSLIPDDDDCRSVFSLVARFLRFWAKKRSIYHSSLGYLSGELINILVARSMQISSFSNRHCIDAIRFFFQIFSEWDYSGNNVISLYSNYPLDSTHPNIESIRAGRVMENWLDPPKRSGFQPMKVLRPYCGSSELLADCPPQQQANAAGRVTWGTFPRMLKEFQCANDVFRRDDGPPEADLLNELCFGPSLVSFTHEVIIALQVIESDRDDDLDGGNSSNRSLLPEAQDLIVPFQIMARRRFDFYRRTSDFHMTDASDASSVVFGDESILTCLTVSVRMKEVEDRSVVDRIERMVEKALSNKRLTRSAFGRLLKEREWFKLIRLNVELRKLPIAL